MEEDIQSLIQDIIYVKDLNAELTSFNVDTEQDKEEIQADVKAGQGALSKYIKGVRHLSKKIVLLIGEAKARSEGASESSWMSRNLGDFGIALEGVGELLWSNDVRDALTILDTLNDSLNKSLSSMAKIYQSVKSEAQRGTQKSVEELLAEEEAKPAPAQPNVA